MHGPSTRAREDYVKAIYQLGYAEPVRAADVARHLGVTPVSVSKAKRMLERDGLLERSDRSMGPLVLSALGRELAVEMIRRHRLLETFLFRALDVPLESIHAEAERIEHVISNDIALRLARYLGYPGVDPHGHVIPYRDEDAREQRYTSLGEFPIATRFCVVSLDDRDPQAVRALAAEEVLPGFEGTLVALDGEGAHVDAAGRTFSVARRHAALVRVVASYSAGTQRAE